MAHRLLTTSSALALCLGFGSLPAATVAQNRVILLDEVVVSATVVPTQEGRIGGSVETYSGEDLASKNGALVTDVLQRAPGVSLTRSGPAGTLTDLRIRGAQEKFISVNIDGIKVNDPSVTSGQFGNFGALGTGATSRIEVLKGAQSALYGGAAVAGAVNIFTLPLADAPEGVSQTADVFFGSYNTVGGSYSYAHNLGRLTVAMGLSHLQSDGFSAADEDDGNTEADGVRESRLSFGARYAATDTLTVGFNGFVEGGEADFDEFGPVDGTPGDDINRRDAHGLRAFAEIDAGAWQHKLALSYFDVERRATSVGSFSFDSRFQAERLRLEYTATGSIGEFATLSFGLDAQEETATYANLVAGNESVTSIGAFAELQYAVNADLDVIATLRFDDHSDFGNEVTGRYAFSYRAADGLTLRGAYSTGYRPPSIDELYGNYPDPSFPFAGNPNLLPETSESLEFGVDYAFANGNSISATVFENRIDNFILFSSCPFNAGFTACLPGTNSSLANVSGISSFTGGELEGRFALSDSMTLTTAYTYIDARDSSGNQLTRVPEHELALGLTAEFSDRITGQFDLRHASGRAAEGFPAVTPEDYTVLDATFTYDVADNTQAYLRIENVTNETYQTVPGFGTSDRAAYFGVRASF